MFGVALEGGYGLGYLAGGWRRVDVNACVSAFLVTIKNYLNHTSE